MKTMLISKPEANEYAPYYHTYIDKVKEDDLISSLIIGGNNFEKVLSRISDEKGDYAYGDGKWTVKGVIVHMLDAERIFAYRALRFSRNDKTPLAGFDENLYVPESNASALSLQSLLEEGIHIRKSTIALFMGMTEAMSLRRGVASNHEVSVRALGYIIAGHEIHHLGVLGDRYGIV